MVPNFSSADTESSFGRLKSVQCTLLVAGCQSAGPSECWWKEADLVGEKTTLEKQAKVCRWKAVTANVLTFQPAVEKDAAGFFASADLSSRNVLLTWKSTLQVYRKDPAPHVRSAGTLWCQLLRTEATVALKLARFQTETYHHPAVRLEVVVHLFEVHCQLDSIVLHAPPAGQTSETKNQASLWWEHTHWQRTESGGGCQWSKSASSGGDLALVSPSKKKSSNKTWKSRQGTKHRIDFLCIAEAVQPQVHSCAPTDALLFGSGHFQDHRAQLW